MKARFIIILLLISFALPMEAQNNKGGVSNYQLLNEFRRNQKKTGTEKTKKKKTVKRKVTESDNEIDSVAAVSPVNPGRKRVTEQVNDKHSRPVTTVSSRKGASSYKKAADEGDAEAQFNLGMCYYYGDGVAQNYATAFEWFENSAKQDYGNAQLWLGKCYLDGTGTESNPSYAMRWLKQAAEKEIAEAQYLLATLYKDGNGVLKDPTLARKWMTKAADNGWKEASRELETM